MHGLTGFQRDLIYCIATIEDPYGQKIKHEVEANLPLDVKNGRLYPNLDKLVKKGLLKKKKKDERTNFSRSHRIRGSVCLDVV